MIYSNLIINEHIWDRLLKLNKKERIPNALLFHGPNGSGKEGHAIEFAALINCLSGHEKSCNSCASCTRIKNFSDENTYLVYPMPRGKITSKKDSPIKALSDKDLENIKMLYKEKAKNPYSKIKIESSRTILINSIINIKRKIYLSSTDDKYKVVIIFDAEKLSFPNNEAANALLKILEEPPERTCFILISSNESKIINTIKSRCQSYYFPPLTLDSVKSSVKNICHNEDEASFVSALSNGDMNFAHTIIESSYNYKLDIQHTIRSIYKKDTDSWSYIYNKMTDGPTKDKIKYHFSLFRISIRDIRMYAATKNINDIHLREYEAIYKKFIENRDSTIFERCLECINTASEMLDRNGYKPIVIWTMLLEINRIMNHEDLERPRYLNA